MNRSTEVVHHTTSCFHEWEGSGIYWKRGQGVDVDVVRPYAIGIHRILMS